MNLKQFEVLLHDAEVKLKRLKALYEQYFQGIERLEPSVPRKDLERTFHRLHKDKPRNTAARFKLNTLQARYNTYSAYWQRISRQIEEGTYARDVRRAHRRRRPEPTVEDEVVKTFELDPNQEIDIDIDIAGQLSGGDAAASAPAVSDARAVGAPTERPGPHSAVPVTTVVDPLPPLEGEDTNPNAIHPFAAPKSATFSKLKAKRSARPPTFRPPDPAASAPRPPARARRPAPAKSSGAPARASGDPMKRLYNDFVAARQKNNQDGKLSYDRLAARVEKMRAKLRQKHGDKKIDFQVVVKDGRVGLKPKIR